MHRYSVFLSLCLMTGFILSLHGCSPITVQSDYDHTLDFSKYKSFAWTESTQSKKHTRRHHKRGQMDGEYHALMEKRLKSNVERVLNSKGFTKTSQDNADLLLMFHFGLKSKIERWRMSGRGGGGRSIRVPVTEDNVVLELIDRKTNDLTWRGWAEGELTDMSNEDKDIKKSIEAILEDFPPQYKH